MGTSTYTTKRADLICRLLAEGHSLRQIEHCAWRLPFAEMQARDAARAAAASRRLDGLIRKAAKQSAGL